MPRVKKTDPSVRVEAQIPESVLDRVRGQLYSEVEGRVPFGAMSELITTLLRNWCTQKETPNANS